MKKKTVIEGVGRQRLHLYPRLQNQMKESGGHSEETEANVPPSTRRVLRGILDSLHG